MAAYFAVTGTCSWGSVEQGSFQANIAVTVTNTGVDAGDGSIIDSSPFLQASGYLHLEPTGSAQYEISVDTTVPIGLYIANLLWDGVDGDAVYCEVDITDATSSDSSQSDVSSQSSLSSSSVSSQSSLSSESSSFSSSSSESSSLSSSSSASSSSSSSPSSESSSPSSESSASSLSSSSVSSSSLSSQSSSSSSFVLHGPNYGDVIGSAIIVPG